MSTLTKPVPFGSDLRAALLAMVRKRVPESEVEDIVQQALAEAIESPHAPQESEALRRWIFGVAKNKVVDYHRRAGRESFELPDVAGTPAPHVEADLLRWAEKNLPEGDENQKTLDWMIREGEGEKLESIAESEKLPPPRVRQRVSRLRRHFKENWQREVALLAALGVIVSAIALFLTHEDRPEPITHDGDPHAAEPVRRLALEKCANKDWKNCVDGLDEARRLDPAGDSRPEVQEARQAADAALKAPPPAPSSDLTPPPPAPSLDPSGFTPPIPAPSGSGTFNAPMKSKAPLDPPTNAKPTLRKPGPVNAKPDSTDTPPAPAPTGSLSPSPTPSKDDSLTPAPTPKSQGRVAPSKKGAVKGAGLGSDDPLGGGGSSGKVGDRK